MDKRIVKSKGEKAIDILAIILTWFFRILMLVYSISLITPIIWMVVNSFKGYQESYLASALALPEVWVFENYINIFDKLVYTVYTAEGKLTYDIWNMIYYSVIFALATSTYSVVWISVTAYAVGRYKNKLTKFLYALGIWLMIIPFTSDGGSGLLLRKQLGIYDNMPALILTAGGCLFTGQYFLMEEALFEKLGKEYAEAAAIDGAGEWTIMIRIIFPLAMPLMTVVFVIGFIAAWNDYGTFMFLLPSYANLALGMYNFQLTASVEGASYPEVLAGFVIVAIPIIIMFIFSQKLMSRNLSIGGLKG